ncbi:calcium-binding protein [Sagittula sp. MA-2]|jgi:hypothetical protein|uniref:calcium-binding protein n=1 Tax=Sagittula sp. MA-2 TaxID=3048007 RepID=UPI0024C3A36A|nr:calcium-binding protein [Sagittula sp. MA-2]WHZ36217.1 calcium-binding protein [Sagittula sp. MA-2]
MFFLVGLLGMMAVGSIVIAGTADVEEGLEDDGLPPDDIGSADAETSVDSLLPALQDATDTAPVAEVISWPGPSADPMDIPTGQAGIDARDVSEPLSLFDVMGLSGLFGESQVDTPSVSSEQQAMPGDDALGVGGAGLTEDGTDDADPLTGADAADLLSGGGGNDLVDGLGGADDLHGGDGADTLRGGEGNDTLYGDGGDDVLRGDGGADVLYGHEGNDSLAGNGGADVLQGGPGDDVLDGGTGNDALHGREGADLLRGGRGSDTLLGGMGNDVLVGVTRDADGTDLDAGDFLNGGDGADTIIAGSGDLVHCGEGTDTLVVGNWIAGPAAELVDYDAAEDQLVIVFDDSPGNAEPELEIRLSADNPAVTEIVLNGHVLTTMPTADAPTLEGLVLVGESMADVLIG